MFYGDLKEADDVKIVDAKSTSFEVFLQIIYHVDENISMENVGDVLCLADKYECKGVMELCASYIDQEINMNNVCLALNLALKYNLSELDKSCTCMVIGCYRKVLQSDAFADVDHTTLVYILNLFENVTEPKLIFDCCMKWARKTCEENLIDITPQNLRKELGSCFDLCIKFTQMDMNEFLKIEPGLFNTKEYRNIVEAIHEKSKLTNRRKMAISGYDHDFFKIYRKENLFATKPFESIELKRNKIKKIK